MLIKIYKGKKFNSKDLNITLKGFELNLETFLYK